MGHMNGVAAVGRGPDRQQGRGQGCTGRGGAPEAVRQAVGGGCQSGWGRLLSVINAIEPGTCRQGDSGWAQAGRLGGGAPPFSMPPWAGGVVRGEAEGAQRDGEGGFVWQRVFLWFHRRERSPERGPACTIRGPWGWGGGP